MFAMTIAAARRELQDDDMYPNYMRWGAGPRIGPIERLAAGS